MMNIKLDSKAIYRYNIMRYEGVAPSQELVDKVVKKSGLKRYTVFELVWGIPSGTLTLVRNKERNLPVKYWHIFYDFEFVFKEYNKLKGVKKILPKKHTINDTSKIKLDELKRQQSATR